MTIANGNPHRRTTTLPGSWRRYLSLGLLLLLSAPAVAGTAGWSEYATIAELTATHHLRYRVQLNLSDGPGGCRSGNTYYQDYAAPGAELMYHTLLEALSRGKQVRIFATGRCDLDGHAELSSVSIRP